MLDNYEILPNGVIHQIKVNKPTEYNKTYVDERYNSYGEKGMQMAYLRYGYMRGVITGQIKSIIDIGYGNGDFLKVCEETIPFVFGNDVSGYPIPKGCNYVDDILKHQYDVVCFFDSLEHFENIDFVKELKTKYIYISVPFCHNDNEDWFMNWKHRREDEHLWHFGLLSLENFMLDMGFEAVKMSSIEDTIRIGNGIESNILTGIFKKI